MRSRSSTFVAAIAAVAAAAACGSRLASAQSARVDPRDLSGHWDRASTLETFGLVPGSLNTRNLPGAPAPPANAPAVQEAPLTEVGKARLAATKPGYGPRMQAERNDPMGRCEPTGLVRNLNTEVIPPHSTFEILQTPGRIIQFFEYRHDWREIWMDGRSLPGDDEVYPKWNGFSVGRWEGDTLVVDSVGFDERTWVDKLGYPHSEQMRVEERYRRVDATTLELVVTITDPVMYTRPWKGEPKRFLLNREKGQHWDEQIYCVPAEEFRFQDVIKSGNQID